NYFFVPPLHQFSVSDSEDLIALGVLLIAALVVGRLAGTARERTAEAEERAEIALAREREATILADAATSMLGGNDMGRLVAAMSEELSSASGAVLRVA